MAFQVGFFDAVSVIGVDMIKGGVILMRLSGKGNPVQTSAHMVKLTMSLRSIRCRTRKHGDHPLATIH
jgi:hypothetical protein